MWIALVLLAAVASVTAVYAVRVLLRRRRALSVEELKRTTPELVLSANLSGRDRVKLAITSKNLVPVECRWVFFTTSNVIVGEGPLHWTKIVPTRKQRVFTVYDSFEPQKVLNAYIEVRFEYRSLYAPADDSAFRGKVVALVEKLR